MGPPGLREHKKRKTRAALVAAGLDLFLAKGYEHTTIEQIAEAVEISPRTFFRYFAGKEDLALDHIADIEHRLLAALAARPAHEPPVTALANAYRQAVRSLSEADRADRERYLKICALLEATPALLGKAIGRMAETERRLTELIARRQGIDAATDLRAPVIVAMVAAAFRVGFACFGTDAKDMDELVARVDAALELAERALSREGAGSR